MKWDIIGSGNGLSPVRRQAIIWNNAGLLSIGPMGTNFSKIRIANLSFFIQENAFENVVCQIGGYFVQGGDKLTTHIVAGLCHNPPGSFAQAMKLSIGIITKMGVRIYMKKKHET